MIRHRLALEPLETRRLLAAPVAVDDHYEMEQDGRLDIGGAGGGNPGSFTPGNIVLSHTDFDWPQPATIREYTPAGALVQTIEIPEAETDGRLVRDVVIDANGTLHVFLGSGSNTKLLTLDGTGQNWSQTLFPDWSVVNDVLYGGLTASGDYIYATDDYLEHAGDPAQRGAVRFNIHDMSAQRIAEGVDPIDLEIGLDGLLYLLTPTGSPDGTYIYVYDPVTLERVGEIQPGIQIHALDVDADGYIYATGHNDTLARMAPDGTVLQNIAMPIGGLGDVDLHPDGRLMVTSRVGPVFLTDTDFSHFVDFAAPEAWMNFGAWVPGDARSALWNDYDDDGDPLTAAKQSDPDRGSLTFRPDGTFTYEPEAGFEGTDTFTYVANDGTTDSNVATVTIVVGSADPAPLAVDQSEPTEGGATVGFSAPLDISTLSLYDTQDAGLGAADVTLVGDTVGAVAGSVVYDPVTNSIEFIKTGGPLEPDTYTLTLRSADDGFRDTDGNLLDGDGDGNPGGDYTFTFTVEPNSDRLLSIPDFSRGPLQQVAVPTSGDGIPLTLSDGDGVNSVDFEFHYDPALLEVTGIRLSDDVPGGWTPIFNIGTPGVMVASLFGATPLGPGEIVVGEILAAVPEDAPYAAAAVLTFDNLALDEGTIPARADSAIQTVAYFGDATGNGQYSGLDAAFIARNAVKLDGGFEHFPLKDPILLGDVTGNGEFSGLDAAFVARKGVGLTQDEVPDLPPDLPPIEPNGPDPLIRIERAFGVDPGDDVTLGIAVVDDAAGITSIDNFTILYDTTVLDVSSSDVAMGTLLQDGGFQQFVNVNDAAGTIRITAFGLEPLAAGTGNLFEITYHVRADAPEGLAELQFSDGTLNEGGLVMTTEDGLIRVGAVRYDLNYDGRIDFADLSFFAQEFLKYTDAPNATELTIRADFDGLGRVDFADLAWFAPNFLKRLDDPNVIITFPPDPPPAPQRLSLGSPLPEGEGAIEVELGARSAERGTEIATDEPPISTPDAAPITPDVPYNPSPTPSSALRAPSSALDTSPIPHSDFRIPHFEDFVDLLPEDPVDGDAIDDLIRLGERHIREIAGTLEDAIDAVFASEILPAAI